MKSVMTPKVVLIVAATMLSFPQTTRAELKASDSIIVQSKLEHQIFDDSKSLAEIAVSVSKVAQDSKANSLDDLFDDAIPLSDVDTSSAKSVEDAASLALNKVPPPVDKPDFEADEPTPAKPSAKFSEAALSKPEAQKEQESLSVKDEQPVNKNSKNMSISNGESTVEKAALAASDAVPVASKPEQLVIADAPQLSTREMSDLRGGFMDPSGMIYRFAVNVQADLNGAQVFSRSMVVSPTGANGQLQAITSANVMPKNLPSNLSLVMLGNGNGVTVVDPAGNTTTVMNQTANGAPSSIILNTGNNRSISQSVALSLTLKNVPSIMNYVHTATQGAALAQQGALRAMGL